MERRVERTPPYCFVNLAQSWAKGNKRDRMKIDDLLSFLSRLSACKCLGNLRDANLLHDLFNR
jgi:hypothetical protein